MKDDALLALASDLVAKAASAIMAIKAAGFAVERKSDHSPVTEADRIAEALIVEGLRAATPDIPVIAEEEVAAGTRARPCRAFLAGGPAGWHAGIRGRAR
jgi:3'(2'), 5'-bisphosphate nucleotidase